MAADDGTVSRREAQRARDPDALTFVQIRERAYELWERNHRPEGLEIEFWLLAERELRAERDRRRASDPVPASGDDRADDPPSG